MEELIEEKSANQIWKESGTTLSFRDWLEREKEKGSYIPNKMITDTTSTIKSNIKAKLGIPDANSSYTVNVSNPNTILGLNKWVLLGSVILIGGIITFKVYNKYKK
jgi:hypothetical protein